MSAADHRYWVARYCQAYNSDSVGTRKTINGTVTDYVWDNALELPVVLTDTNALYLHGLSLIAQQAGANASYYHADGLGSDPFIEAFEVGLLLRLGVGS